MFRIRRIEKSATHHQTRLTKILLSLGIVLASCASVFGPNLAPLFAQEEVDRYEAPGARSITFPEWSMGQLYIRPWGGMSGGWTAYQPAMGVVGIPSGMEVYLRVDNNAVIDLSPLGYLNPRDIQAISLRGTEVQNDQLQYLQGLELYDLDLQRTAISNEGLQYIENMTTLERLEIGRSNVTNEGIHYLSELVELRILDLNLTGVNDEGFAHLANLINLESLDL